MGAEQPELPEVKVIGAGDSTEKSASVQMTRDANAAHEVTDSTGRKIILRKPDLLAEFDAVGLIDDRLPGAQAQRSMVGPLLYVVSIDSEAVDPPASANEIRVIMKRLGTPGYMAVIAGIEKHWADQKKTGEKEAALKKS